MAVTARDRENVATDSSAYPLLIKQLWHAPLAHSPDQEIVYRDRVRFSYRELYRRVGRLGAVLRGLGIERGQTVAVMDWDSHRYLESYYAIPMVGAVLMMVNVRLSPEQILYTINHSGAELLLVNSEFRSTLETLWPKLETVRQIVWLTDEEDAPPSHIPCAGAYEALLSGASPLTSFPDFDENARATTFYTTGTTGLPKGVFFSHRQLVLHTLSAMAALASPQANQRFHRGDVYMPLTPMFHVHAWGIPFVALQVGVKQVYPGRYLPEHLLSLIEREGVTFSHCVPTILQMLLQCPNSPLVDLSHLKLVIGGSALSPALASAACERGIDVFGGYGMSETCPMLSIAQVHPHLGPLEGEEELAIRCKAGAPLPLVELRTVDPDMADVAADGRSTGEVVVRAPWLTQGYWQRPEASEELWVGGYLHTQDIGFIENGYLKVTDRIKDVIKTGGEWVSSLQIENLISQHPTVLECAVVGVKDARWGERPIAVVVAATGSMPDERELKAHVGTFSEKGEISKYAIPSRVIVVEALPKTSVGKVDKKSIREKYTDLAL